MVSLQGVDESGDVFRATYAAFRCSPISGVLEGHSVQKVSSDIFSQPSDGNTVSVVQECLVSTQKSSLHLDGAAHSQASAKVAAAQICTVLLWQDILLGNNTMLGV